MLHLCGLQASVAALEAKLGDVYVNDAFGTAHRAGILDLLRKIKLLLAIRLRWFGWVAEFELLCQDSGRHF